MGQLIVLTIFPAEADTTEQLVPITTVKYLWEVPEHCANVHCANVTSAAMQNH